MPSDLSPGELVAIRVTFVEDRNGRALVRLANGSKATLDYDGIRPIGGCVNFVRRSDAAGERAWCGLADCVWRFEGTTRVDAEDAYEQHLATAHPAEHRG